MPTLADPEEALPGATTTLVRADSRTDRHPELHPQLKAQLRELSLRTGKATPDVAMLLSLINSHYQTMEGERRGIAESMRLMADEARAPRCRCLLRLSAASPGPSTPGRLGWTSRWHGPIRAGQSAPR